MLPAVLLKFLNWMILEAEDSESASADLNLSGDLTSKCILAIAQDLIFRFSKGRILTPKHVLLANAIQQMTRNKSLLMIMNRHGHCVSYEQINHIYPAVATQ